MPKLWIHFILVLALTACVGGGGGSAGPLSGGPVGGDAGEPAGSGGGLGGGQAALPGQVGPGTGEAQPGGQPTEDVTPGPRRTGIQGQVIHGGMEPGEPCDPTSEDAPFFGNLPKVTHEYTLHNESEPYGSEEIDNVDACGHFSATLHYMLVGEDGRATAGEGDCKLITKNTFKAEIPGQSAQVLWEDCPEGLPPGPVDLLLSLRISLGIDQFPQADVIYAD